VIAEIVQVRAQKDARQSQRARTRPGDLQELRLAVVASIGGILRESGPVKLMRYDHFMSGADQRGQLFRLALLAFRHGLGHRGQGQATRVSQHVVRHAQQQRRIDAPRKTHHGGAAIAERGAEPLILAAESRV
jgi:hypothetical protein